MQAWSWGDGFPYSQVSVATAAEFDGTVGQLTCLSSTFNFNDMTMLVKALVLIGGLSDDSWLFEFFPPGGFLTVDFVLPADVTHISASPYTQSQTTTGIK
ncbi:hypothetical protein DYB28_008391 [Aphanomyces astaci]|uniref:Uncharacterized protein n=1 Tax=Aphanomyces astaci TaxID=112090 RepID=A0A9X8DYC0_APHAT|nr:hypothetical protein DYB28_008391 [Aphanomyces astaci]